MMKIIDPKKEFSVKEHGELPEHPFTFPLDNFQKYAISCISKEENVLITAKTGSGKTLVGEYQIYHSLKNNKRIFYTTPIKSLSNQKFNDLKKIHGNDKVGIITGDIKFQPQAQILVMTTEILRNLLYKNNTSTSNFGVTAGISLDGLDSVIFDEVHYINDPERGKVWEETMILLPKYVKMVLLSATIDSPEIFTEWLAKIRNRNITLISTDYRIVPLTHYIYSENNEILELMNNKNCYNDLIYKNWLKQRSLNLRNNDVHIQAVKNRLMSEDENVVKRDTRIVSSQHKLNICIEMLEVKNLLPALFFVFSRKDCEKYAKNVTKTLIDTSDIATVKHIISFHLHPYMKDLEHLEQYHFLVTLLTKGVAFHHSGLVPVLKEIVEILFVKGYVKVLFATETFAVGLNMPTKTVVFLDYKKYDDKAEGLRILRTDEYLQMAGRAGRRGIDTSGTVIYLPMREPISLEDNKKMMTGKTCSITSKMNFGYEFLLKILHSKSYTYQEIIDSSFYTFYNYKIIEELKNANCELLSKQEKLIEPCFLVDLHRKHHLETLNKSDALLINSEISRKDIQKELSLWNNKHVGPKWATVIKTYSEWLKFKTNIESNNTQITNILNFSVIDDGLDFLTKRGYINYIERDDMNDCEVGDMVGKIVLTSKGILATEINQANCILLVETYINKKLNDLSVNEILGFASMFLSNDIEKHGINNYKLNEIFTYLNCIKKELIYDSIKSIDSITYKNSNICVSDEWVNCITEWASGEEIQILVQKYDIFPGNLFRCLSGINNIIDEINTISTICNDVEMLNKLTECKNILNSSIANFDSLYLRL